MSTTTFGPAVDLELPPPSPPPFNLLTVATELSPALDGEGGLDPHWRMGGVVWPFPPELPSGEDPCAEGSLGEKDEAEGLEEDELPRFGAFTAYQPIVCSTFGTRDFDELKRRARAALVAHEANALERQLAFAEFKTDNPFLGESGEVEILGGGAVDPKEALELLEEAIGETAEAGVIHATPDVVVSWSALGNALVVVSGQLRTLGGTPVVRATGLIGGAPEGQSAPAAGNAWAWASGPVFYQRSELDLFPEDVSSFLDREQNRLVYRAERDYLVAWDGDLQAAVLVDRDA